MPYIGVQFVGIPEFTDLGTKFSQYVSSAIAGYQFQYSYNDGAWHHIVVANVASGSGSPERPATRARPSATLARRSRSIDRR